MKKFQQLENELRLFYSTIKEAGTFLYEHPEIARNEFSGAAYLSSVYEENGFLVERGVGGFPTCFLEIYENGSSSPCVGFFSDFDALPGLALDGSGGAGHGCMHNLYAATTLGTAIALKNYMEKEQIKGRIIVFGAPAEEDGGSKQYLARQGMYKQVDAFFGMHPVPESNGVMFRKHIAILSKKYRFFGKKAKVMDPQSKGHNALYAAEYFHLGIELFKLQEHPDCVISAIISEGGSSTSLIPEYSEVTMAFRGLDIGLIEELEKHVDQIADGAASAFNCSNDKVEVTRYHNSNPNHRLARCAQSNALCVGSPVYSQEELDDVSKRGYPEGFFTEIQDLPDEPVTILGGTDEGDASWLVPWLRISLASCPRHVPAHSLDFVYFAQSEYVHRGLQKTALAAAMTAVDFLTDENLRLEAKQELNRFQVNNIYPDSYERYPHPSLFPVTPGVKRVDEGVYVNLKKCPLFAKLQHKTFYLVDGNNVLAKMEQGEEDSFLIPLPENLHTNHAVRLCYTGQELITDDKEYFYTLSYIKL